jgi:hypothetical protein
MQVKEEHDTFAVREGENSSLLAVAGMRSSQTVSTSFVVNIWSLLMDP